MDTDSQIRGGLDEGEVYWRDRYNWLHEQGYILRSRYKPDWVPSWKGTSKPYDLFEDGISSLTSHVLDATRQLDGQIVVLKRISSQVHPYEISIGQYLCSPPLSSDYRNHCCLILDVLEDPLDTNLKIIVMPLLRRYNDPRFITVGEAVDFFRQAFEGLWFMHDNHVAHRDCMTLNIMLDPVKMFPQLYHPMSTESTLDIRGDAPYYSRTRRPPRYNWTDFGLSRQYEAGNTNPLEDPILGGDRTVPEYQEDDVSPRNPFHTDVYYLGNLIREDFLRTFSNLTFMHPLIASMVRKQPERRPTMQEAVHELDKIISRLPSWKLRARLRKRNDHGVISFLKDVEHVFRATAYILLFLPPIPKWTPATSQQAKPIERRNFGFLRSLWIPPSCRGLGSSHDTS